jgi:hypothetical protein
MLAVVPKDQRLSHLTILESFITMEIRSRFHIRVPTIFDELELRNTLEANIGRFTRGAGINKLALSNILDVPMDYIKVMSHPFGILEKFHVEASPENWNEILTKEMSREAS